MYCKIEMTTRECLVTCFRQFCLHNYLVAYLLFHDVPRQCRLYNVCSVQTIHTIHAENTALVTDDSFGIRPLRKRKYMTLLQEMKSSVHKWRHAGEISVTD